MIDSVALASSTPDQVATYLRTRGWTRAYSDPGGSAWTNNDEPDAELWLPRSSAMRSYQARIASLVGALAEHEERSPGQILFDITHAFEDVQRIRSLPRGYPGTVPLNDSAEMIDGLRRWILSAATSVAVPEQVAVHPSRKPAEVDDFMGRVRLAVPEEGSFVWKISVPIADSDGTRSLPFPQSVEHLQLYDFGRQVTAQLYRSTRTVMAACREVLGGADLLNSFRGRVDRGVSANLCEALTETAGEHRTPYEIRFSWAANVPSAPSEVIRFEAGQIELVKQAAVELRKIAPESDATIQGYVVRLFRESEQRPGQVTLAGTVLEDARETFGHFWVELTNEDYHSAVIAHDSNRRVSVSGDIVRHGNLRRLERARNFQIIEESD